MAATPERSKVYVPPPKGMAVLRHALRHERAGAAPPLLWDAKLHTGVSPITLRALARHGLIEGDGELTRYKRPRDAGFVVLTDKGRAAVTGATEGDAR